MENQEATIHNNHEPDAANAKRKRSNHSSSSNCSSTSTSDEGNGANLSVEELMKQLGQMCGVGRNRRAGGPTTEANGGKKHLVPDKHLREQFKTKMADMKEECANRKAEISDLEGRVRVLTSKNEPRHAVRIVQMQGLANKLKAKNDKVKRGLHTILYQRSNGAGGGGSTSNNSIFGNDKKARPPPTANRQSAAVAASSVGGGGGEDQFFGHPLAKREKQSSAAVAAVDFIGRHCSAKVVAQWRRMNE